MNEKQAIELLNKYSNSPKDLDIVLRHSRKVKEIAVEIARKIPDADIKFVKTAALLHDIGRFKCPPWKDSDRHGIEGGKTLRNEGFPKHARVAERHMGPGITKEDIIEHKLNLPRKDFIPKSTEEKIVTMADKLVDMDKRITLAASVERFKKEVSTRVADRIIKLHKELRSMQKSGRSRKTKGRAGKTCKKDNSE
jgi:uncharacterized protein (TIGR00295 family)